MNYRIERLGSFAVVGFKERVNTKEAFNVIPSLWEKAKHGGQIDRLVEILWASPPKNPRGILGICANGDFGKGEEFDYYIAALSDHEPPVGTEKLNFPESAWAVFEASPELDVQGIWKSLYTEWIPTSGYNLANMPGIECYYPPGQHPTAEVWIAVEIKAKPIVS